MGPLSLPRIRTLDRNTRNGSAAKGCLIALAVLVVIVVGTGIFVALNWKNWMADGISAVSRSMVDSSSLVQADKDKITQKIDTVMKDFKDGKVTMAQLGKLSEDMVSGPLIPLGMVSMAEKEYFPVAAFTPEEAAEAKRALERCARGVAEKKIANTKINDILAPIATTQSNGQFQLKPKEQVKKEDVVKLVQNAKTEADAAGIPDEAFDVDIAKEVCDSIDRALGTTTP